MGQKLYALGVAAVCVVAFAAASWAQTVVPAWIGSLLLGNNPLQGADPSTPTITDALGFKFELYYAATDAQDPMNATNEVIGIDTTGGAIGVALRKLYPGVKIETLTDQLNVKYFFPARTCAGGSPRIQLAVDLNGDNTPEGNLFGYIGHAGFGGGCLTGVWDFVDLTDAVPLRWDLTQFGGGFQNWQGAVAYMDTAFPTHRILSGALVDDSAGFAKGAAGQAYYDLVTVGHRTLENWQDTVHP